jgi:hypothetical protein
MEGLMGKKLNLAQIRATLSDTRLVGFEINPAEGMTKSGYPLVGKPSSAPPKPHFMKSGKSLVGKPAT